jgi:hypothetical protein
MMKVWQSIYSQPWAEWQASEGETNSDDDGIVDAEVEEDDKK